MKIDLGGIEIEPGRKRSRPGRAALSGDPSHFPPMVCSTVRSALRVR
jgi:hypothetical protein